MSKTTSHNVNQLHKAIGSDIPSVRYDADNDLLHIYSGGNGLTLDHFQLGALAEFCQRFNCVVQFLNTAAT